MDNYSSSQLLSEEKQQIFASSPVPTEQFVTEASVLPSTAALHHTELFFIPTSLWIYSF